MQSKRRFKSSIVLTAILLSSLAALAAAEPKPVVNINTADAKQLSLLPRIGLAVAQRIVDYRKENGPFKSTDELMLVRGVGEKLYAQLKPYVVTAGETTLAEKAAGAGRGDKAKGSSKRSSKTAKTPKAAKTAAKAAPARSAAARTAAPSRISRAARSTPPRSARPAAGGRR